MTKFQQSQLSLAASARLAAARQPEGSTIALVYTKAAEAYVRMAEFTSLAKAKAATR
jgi:hypothetical protein